MTLTSSVTAEVIGGDGGAALCPEPRHCSNGGRSAALCRARATTAPPSMER